MGDYIIEDFNYILTFILLTIVYCFLVHENFDRYFCWVNET